MIILCLSRSKHLTKAQKVSSFWKNAITQPPTIQRCLGLRYEPNRTLSPLGFRSNHMWPPPRADMSIVPDLPVYPRGIYANEGTRHPGLGLGWRRKDSTQGHPNHAIILSKRSFEQASSAGFRPTWLEPFLTIPCITVAYLQLEMARTVGKEGSGSFYDYWSSASMRDPGGLTFDTVLEAAEKMRRSVPVNIQYWENARQLVRFISEP